MQRVRLSSHQGPVHKLGDSQMTLSPKFRLAVFQSSMLNPSPELELSLQNEPLIPGLPDGVALNCLLRLPVETHATSRAVCKRCSVIKSDSSPIERNSGSRILGSVFAFHKCTGKIQWQVLDLIQFSWHTIPLMLNKEKVCPHGLRCVSVPRDGTLFICGRSLSVSTQVMHWNVQGVF